MSAVEYVDAISGKQLHIEKQNRNNKEITMTYFTNNQITGIYLGTIVKMITETEMIAINDENEDAKDYRLVMKLEITGDNNDKHMEIIEIYTSKNIAEIYKKITKDVIEIKFEDKVVGSNGIITVHIENIGKAKTY